MRALFDDVDLDVLRQLMDVNFGSRLPHQICPTLSASLEGIDRRRIVGGRYPRFAGTHGLFGFEIRDDGIYGDYPY